MHISIHIYTGTYVPKAVELLLLDEGQVLKYQEKLSACMFMCIYVYTGFEVSRKTGCMYVYVHICIHRF